MKEKWKNIAYCHDYKISNFGNVKSNKKNGEKHNFSKLKSEQVVEIRKLTGKINYSNIAKKYNVHRQCISDIINNKTWKHLLCIPKD